MYRGAAHSYGPGDATRGAGEGVHYHKATLLPPAGAALAIEAGRGLG